MRCSLVSLVTLTELTKTYLNLANAMRDRGLGYNMDGIPGTEPIRGGELGPAINGEDWGLGSENLPESLI